MCHANQIQVQNMLIHFQLDGKNISSMLFPFLCEIIVPAKNGIPTGILLVPVWQTQPQFIPFLHLFVDNPVLLSQLNHLLTQSHFYVLHPLPKQLIDGLQAIRESQQQRYLSYKAMAIILKSWIQLF